MAEWGTVSGGLAENIAYGSSNADRIVMQFIIDDGVPGRGHRLALMNSAWGATGTGYGPHARYNFEAVILYAVSFTDNAATKAKNSSLPACYTGQAGPPGSSSPSSSLIGKNVRY